MELEIQEKKDTIFKRKTALLYYKLLNLLGADIIFNHADFRLLSKTVLEELSKYKEVNLFLRGIIPMIGYESSIIYYDRKPRMKGESKYTLKKMLNLAFDGITFLSIASLRFILYFGIIFTICCFLSLISLIGLKIFLTDIDLCIIFICILFLLIGINIIFIGVLGEYLGKIYFEVKERPKYSISEIIK